MAGGEAAEVRRLRHVPGILADGWFLTRGQQSRLR